MNRGTTPTHIFTMSDTSIIKEIKITYAQKNVVVLEKRTEDCIIEVGKVFVRLTQEETFKFSHNSLVDIQIRILTHDDNALISQIITVPVGVCLDNEVLV